MHANWMLAAADFGIYAVIGVLLARAFRRTGERAMLYLAVPLAVVPLAGIAIAFTIAGAVDGLLPGAAIACGAGGLTASLGTSLAFVYFGGHIFWGLAALIAVVALTGGEGFRSVPDTRTCAGGEGIER